MELPFAGLHQLCAPMLGRLDALPGPAAGGARRRAGPGARRRRPTASWSRWPRSACWPRSPRSGRCCASSTTRSGSTRASAQVLGFVARRLLAESVAIVFAVRDPTDARELAGPAASSRSAGSPTRTRARCWRPSSRAGSTSASATGSSPRRAATRWRSWSCRAALAATQLPAALGLQTATALPGRIEESFLRRLEALPDDARLLLLVAAAEPVGDPLLVWRAAERLGIGRRRAADDRGAAGDRRARGRSCIRSCARRSIARRRRGERRAVHRALAEVTDAERRRRSPRLAPRRGRGRARRGRRRRARALRRPGAGARRARRGGGVPAAVGRADARSRAGASSARWRPRRPACTPARSTRRSSCWPPRRPAPLDELQRARVRPAARADRVRPGPRQRRAAAAAARAAQRLEPLDLALARETYLDALGRGAVRRAARERRRPARGRRAARRRVPPPATPRAARPAARRPRARRHRGTAAAAPVLRGAASAFAGDRTPRSRRCCAGAGWRPRPP